MSGALQRTAIKLVAVEQLVVEHPKKPGPRPGFLLAERPLPLAIDDQAHMPGSSTAGHRTCLVARAQKRRVSVGKEEAWYHGQVRAM
tara:strand:- start:564 stop:824 length:261 start_codon:yes stop_codon:yes gene_type:complete